MDFNKLSANEKLAVYGSVAVIVGGLVSVGLGGLGLLAVIAALGMLAVLFLPQFSPSTTLPGSKGSLMLILGGIAAVVMLLALLTIISLLGFYFQSLAVNAIFFLIAVAGGLLMGWAGWQEFQAEGGKFVLGTASPRPGTPVAPPARTGAAPPAQVDAEPPVRVDAETPVQTDAVPPPAAPARDPEDDRRPPPTA